MDLVLNLQAMDAADTMEGGYVDSVIPVGSNLSLLAACAGSTISLLSCV